jgi:hypothetical protein
MPCISGKVLFKEQLYKQGGIINIVRIVGVKGMYRRDIQLPAYLAGSKIEAEFRMGMDNIQVQGPGYINDLFFNEKSDPVLGLAGKLKRSDPEHPFLGYGVGMLDRENIDPVAPVFQFRFQGTHHRNHPVYLGGIGIAKDTNVHISLSSLTPVSV